jgi:hypothetical protein
LKCKCGLNAEGKSYCPKTYTKTYTENLATIIETFGQLCHTLDRFDIYKCYLRQASQEEYPQSDLDFLHQFIIDYFERNHLEWI